MGHKDLPAVQHVRQRNGTVLAPVVQDLDIINEDDEIVHVALVEDLGGGVVGAHCVWWCDGGLWEREELTLRR